VGIVVGAVLLVASALCAAALPGWWRSGGTVARYGVAQVFGPVVARASRRGFIPALGLMVCLAVFSIASSFRGTHAVALIGALGAVSAMALEFLVMVVNRPKILVPPSLRHEPGLSSPAAWRKTPAAPPDSEAGTAAGRSRRGR